MSKVILTRGVVSDCRDFRGESCVRVGCDVRCCYILCCMEDVPELVRPPWFGDLVSESHFVGK